MLTCLVADVIIALKRDLIIASPNISNCSIKSAYKQLSNFLRYNTTL
jgi:hypothetical protein